jgi:hypothetical protein
MNTIRSAAMVLVFGILSASTSRGDFLASYTGDFTPASYAAAVLTASGKLPRTSSQAKISR